MSFQVETSPNQYTDYQTLATDRLADFGRQFLSLFNPNYDATVNTVENDKEHVLQHPSDLCRPSSEQLPYYLVNQDTMNQIEEHFLPNQSIFPYTTPVHRNATNNNNNDNDQPMTNSMVDWPTTNNPADRNLPSQIVTIIQCRSSATASSLGFNQQQTGRHAVRLLIHAQHQQQRQMETFLDTINEALLLEPDTIKTLWDTRGDQIKDPIDLLRRGRLYFASREQTITPDQLSISDEEMTSINRFERIRQRLSQSAHLVDRPISTDNLQTPSRKSTPFNADDRRSATVQAQAIAYNDPQTFPEVFLRHYSVGDIIGDGRFSAVLECRDKATGIQLALKIIDKHRCQGFEYLIENELAILRRVKHPNIIKLVEEFQTDQKYFLILEYVSSGDLLAAISTMNKYSEHDVALMLSQIASALKYLHSLQIVHRDVKLDNILMSNYPDQSVTLKLADFGLALCLTNETPRHTGHTDSLCGTPMYMAPEVIEQRDYRIENDLWSLGIIAFTLLSGMAPFNGDNDEEILRNVMTKSIDWSLLPKIPADCRDALLAMLERDPGKRISASGLLQHPWIKRQMQRRIEPISDGASARRRKKGTTRQQPLLTFSSVENPHPIQATNLGDIDEL